MKHRNLTLIAITLPLCILTFLSFTTKKKFKVTGQITNTQSYCGGAVPTPEKLKDMNTPKPIKGKSYFVRKGKVNSVSSPIVAELSLNEMGQYEIHLQTGTYSVVSAEKKDKVFYNEMLKLYSKETEHYTAMDKKCLDQWLQTPDFTIEVKGKDTIVNHNFQEPCPWKKVPCANYKGPFPP